MTTESMMRKALDVIAHEFLKSRRSVRRFLPTCPDQEVLERVVSSATLAPSPHNRQPWRFAIVQDEGLRTKLAREMGSKLKEDRTLDGDDRDEIQRDVARSYDRIANAPVVIVVALSMREMDVYSDERRNRCEYLMAVQGAAMAGQNLLLAAHAEGLGACWMCGPLFCPSTVNQALGLPNDWEAQGLIALGYPAAHGTSKPRKPIGEVATFFPTSTSTGTKH
ncbi:MAG: nitroreductase family protein [Afipia sp.]|nr:nitroreductase family protein [Afipia sp.]